MNVVQISAPTLLLGVLIPLLCSLQGHASECDPQMCAQDFQMLASCLLEMQDNLLQISTTFFPPRETPPVFVEVVYMFGNSTLYQTWYWTEGAFYFVIPLDVLTFSSLLFASPATRVSNLDVTLPGECANASEFFMETLTQRLKLYAMYQSTTPILGDAYSARAANINTIDYYHTPDEIHYIALLISFAVIFPIITTVHIFITIRGNRSRIKKHIKKQAENSSKHPIIAALITLSLTFTTFICAADVAAMRATFANDVQDKVIGNDMTALISLTIIHSVFDLIVLGVLVVNLLMACSFSHVHKDNNSCITSRWHHFYYLCTSPFCWGRHRNDETATNNTASNEKGYKLFYVLYIIMIIPFVCLASHFHYIIIAWVIDPYYAGAIFIIYGVAFFTYLFTYRNIYICFKEISQSPKEAPPGDRNQVQVQARECPGFNNQAPECPGFNNPVYSQDDDNGDPNSTIQQNETPTNPQDSQGTNMQEHNSPKYVGNKKITLEFVVELDVESHLCKCSVQQKAGKQKKEPISKEEFHIIYVIAVFLVGIFILVGCQAMLSCLLFFLPQNRAIEHAPSRIFSLYQGFAIVIAAFIAYKLFLSRKSNYDQLGFYTYVGGDMV